MKCYTGTQTLTDSLKLSSQCKMVKLRVGANGGLM